jgi:choline dehydrogenase
MSDDTASSRPLDAPWGLNNSDWSSRGGPLSIGHGAWKNPITSWLTKGFAELGLEALSSFGSGRLLGWSFIPQTLDQKTQMRSSSTQMLYSAIAEGNQISLYKSSLAKKIVFAGKRATVVVVESAGTQYFLKANKEVIVSAGVVCDIGFTAAACADIVQRCARHRCSWSLESDRDPS